MSLSSETRSAVRVAFDYRCGYCGVTEIWAGGELEIDHFRPVARGGSDALTNLVYACASCNRFKSDYWPDDDSPDSLKLLHPDEDDLAAHIFEASNGRLVGFTSRGWFHIRWLHLNRPQLIELRQLLHSDQVMREALTLAQEAKIKLQTRIRELEIEIAQLQEIISRLTESE